MINLLPKSSKHALRKEYKHRVFVLWLSSFLALSLLMLGALVPSYILASYKNKSALGGIMSAGNNDKIDQQQKDLELHLAEIKGALGVLKSNEDSKLFPTDVIALINTHSNQDITITFVNYESSIDQDSPVRVTVKGSAKDRKSLLALTQGLKGEKRIQKIDLPVSNFAKDTNLEFSFDIYGL